MIKRTQFQIDQSIPVVKAKRETQEERFARLKHIADITGRHFIHVYLEDGRKRQRGNQG